MTQINHYLFELGTEELPPKSLKTLADALTNSVRAQLEKRGVAINCLSSFAAPRRLGLLLECADKEPDQTEEKRGPAVRAAFDDAGKLTRAGQGFLDGLNNQLADNIVAGNTTPITAADLIIIAGDRGDYIGYRSQKMGQKTADLLPDVLQKALDELPIAKRMRSGSDKTEFVRPVKWVVLLENDTVIDATIQGLQTSNQTRGHRYHAPEFLTIRHAQEYERALESAFVIADFAKRQAVISAQVAKIVNNAPELAGAVAIMPPDLLDEVTALVDYPVALLAGFDARFLDVPQEALISTMQADQKYVCLTQNGKLLPKFIFISNIDSRAREKVILGNEKVIRPRLADAEFFFLQDQKLPLADYTERLKNRVFQEQLGTLFDKSERIAKLAAFIVQSLNQNQNADDTQSKVEQAARAGMLSKADLATTLVGEFPELQGIAGNYYARASGERDELAVALTEQYLPKFSGDELPKTELGAALSLADKLDTLVGIFAINQPPSGSKDPFSLRRAAIGVLRILIENRLPLNLVALIEQALLNYQTQLSSINLGKTFTDVMAFITARYGAYYEQYAPDTLAAVTAIAPHMPLDFDERMRAVAAFRKSDVAAVLAQNNKRVANILAKSAGQTADDKVISSKIDEVLLTEAAERALFAELNRVQKTLEPLAVRADYAAMLTELSTLALPLTAFFEDVMVNVDDERLKRNRLALLAKTRALFLSVADVGALQL